MKIGFSFFWPVIQGKSDPNRSDIWRIAFPDINYSLIKLKEFGITSIELKLTENLDCAEVIKSIEKLLKIGFNVTLHASGRIQYPKDLIWQVQNIGQISKTIIEKFNFDPLWVIHPLVSSSIKRDLLFEQTIEYLNKIVSYLNGIPAKIAVEILRPKEKERCVIGQDYYEILEIVSKINSEKVGICWDFGHAYAAYEINVHDQFPPVEFLDKVIHCHVHDSKNQMTHLLLGEGDLSYQDNIKLLLKRGYDGIFNLEIVPHKTEEPKNFLMNVEKNANLILKT